MFTLHRPFSFKFLLVVIFFLHIYIEITHKMDTFFHFVKIEMFE